jgi:hypothetical protein
MSGNSRQIGEVTGLHANDPRGAWGICCKLQSSRSENLSKYDLNDPDNLRPDVNASVGMAFLRRRASGARRSKVTSTFSDGQASFPHESEQPPSGAHPRRRPSARVALVRACTNQLALELGQAAERDRHQAAVWCKNLDFHQSSVQGQQQAQAI